MNESKIVYVGDTPKVFAKILASRNISKSGYELARLLIKEHPQKDRTTKSGIAIPDIAKLSCKTGDIISKSDNSVYAIGDVVAYSNNCGQQVDVDGEMYLLIEEKDVIYSNDFQPGVGLIRIKLPPKVEKKNGIWIGFSEEVGNDEIKAWERECQYILNDIKRTNDKARRNKMTDRELIEYAHRHYPSKPVPKQTLGVDKYNTIHGQVIGLPKKMLVDKDSGVELPCEAKVGDDIYFHYLALSNAEDWHDKGAQQDDWAIVTYSSIFFAKRPIKVANIEIDEKIVMINNFVLLEEIESEPLSKVIVTEKRVSTQKGRVAYVPEGSELKVGQIAYWMKAQNVKLEYEMIQTMPKPYIRVKEEMIVATE